MSDHPLFVGLPLTESYLHELKKLPPALINTFIKGQSAEYLQQIECDGVLYLGKSLETPYDLAALDSLQTHVYSLLKKLIPDYPYELHPLLLLPLPTLEIN